MKYRIDPPAIVATLLFFVARRSVREAYVHLDVGVRQALAMGDRALEAAAARQAREERELLDTRERDTSRARTTYQPILTEIEDRRVKHLERIEDKYPRLLRDIVEQRDENRTEEEAGYAESMARIRREAETEQAQVEAEFERATSECDSSV